MRALSLAALLLAGCNSDTKSSSPSPSPPREQPGAKTAAKPAPEGDVLPPYARTPKVVRRGELGKPLEWNAAPPTLDTAVTGVRTKDSAAAELDRCKLTAWSYSGCWNVYPTQGRIWTRFECEHVVDDYQRAVVCHNYAEHLAVGDGGPPDRARGVEILSAGCDHGERLDCTTLAELLVWEQPDLAATYIPKGCDPDPRNNSQLCNDLLAGDRIERYTVAVTDVTGLDGITTATTCSLGIIANRGRDCRVHVACGDRVLYGATSGSAPCTLTAAGPTGGESMTSAEDNDPAVELGGTTIHLHDDAGASTPAWDLRGTLERIQK